MNARSDQSTSSETTQRKPFGLWSAVFLVVANMIGAGVFTTSGFSLASLGNRQHVMVAWLVGGVIAICGAISYGQLARRITESGGEYLFLSRLIHPAVGFLAGWVSLLAGFTGAIAFAALGFESYAIPESVRPDWFLPGSAGVASILLFGALHSLVLRFGVATQNTIVVLKVVLLVAFVGFAFWAYPANWEGMRIADEQKSFSVFAIASTLVWISLSFSGFNAAVYITSEVESPARNVPRALLIGTLIVTVLYLALNFVFVFGPSPSAVSGVKEVAAVSAQAIGGDRLAILVRVIVCVALLSSVSSMIVVGPRVYAKMANDGVFPKLFDWQGAENEANVPSAAIWLQVIFASVVVCFSSLKDLLDYLGFTLSVSAALTVACLFWSQRNKAVSSESKSELKPESSHSLVGVAWLYRLIAGVYVLATLSLAMLAVIDRPVQLVGFAITVASGLGLYLFLAKRS